MKQYLDFLKHLLDHGIEKTDRTGTGTISVFGYQMRFDLNEGFPLPTTKKLLQFYVANNTLSCQLYQRSADIFLGVPFNIASYSLLLMMVAQVTGLKPGDFIHTFGDAHIYKNHIEQVYLQLKREPRKLPQIKLNPRIRNIFDFTFDDFVLEQYDPYPHIKGEVSV